MLEGTLGCAYFKYSKWVKGVQVPWFNKTYFARFWHFEHVLSLSIKYFFSNIFFKNNKLLRLFVKRGVLNNSHSAYYFNRQTIRYFEPNAYRLLWSGIPNYTSRTSQYRSEYRWQKGWTKQNTPFSMSAENGSSFSKWYSQFETVILFLCRYSFR